ncbi:uncharacterized protein LAJ45_09456 [Morchella importuna]|uniref:uncharacterized protein n=1 Tax=Morchella importuna TaxID=1174673 RepID=UPI001E8D9A9B|nr:uncharacterized protein LAJ45_09456 [Morchella importuna]KAH8146510.1 hypothetical protein LAJ45_09456 [Morchella importuna]
MKHEVAGTYDNNSTKHVPHRSTSTLWLEAFPELEIYRCEPQLSTGRIMAIRLMSEAPSTLYYMQLLDDLPLHLTTPLHSRAREADHSSG